MQHIAKQDKKTLLVRICSLFFGSIIAGFGISLAIKAGFGQGTLAVLWQGLSLTFSISLGQASLLVAALMLLFCFFFDRTQIGLGTILNQILYSFSVDIFVNLLHLSESNLPVFFLMLLGIVLFAGGTGIYAAADLGRGSYEALSFALSGKLKKSLRSIRVAQDALVVILGVALGGAIGWCSLFMILFSGPIIQKVSQLCKKLYEGNKTFRHS